jgi:tetratricopeptide (TPR) repeat protein
MRGAVRLHAGTRRCLCALGALVLVACGASRGAAYDRAYAEAERAESAGRLDEAARAYDRAAQAARHSRDRDAARWSAADVLSHAGRLPDAVARLDALAADARSDHQVEAAYRAALLRVEHEEADRGWHDLEQLVRRFPSHGVAHVALRKLVEHADATSPRAGLDELNALGRDLEGTDLTQLVAYLSAVHLEQLGDDAGAYAAYMRIASRWPYPRGPFFDDVLWNASLLDEKAGRGQAAVDDLERLVAVRETTTLVGSYERARYVPAMLRIGKLYADVLHDRERARATYHRLYADFAHSTMRDDALWKEAALWRQDGDATAACSRLSTLVHEFPDSRYVPCATASCPGVERPSKSGAPKECREYIERDGGERRE